MTIVMLGLEAGKNWAEVIGMDCGWSLGLPRSIRGGNRTPAQDDRASRSGLHISEARIYAGNVPRGSWREKDPPIDLNWTFSVGLNYRGLADVLESGVFFVRNVAYAECGHVAP